MIVAVQFLYCFLKDVVEALLVGYSDEGKHEIAREDATCCPSDAADGECQNMNDCMVLVFKRLRLSGEVSVPCLLCLTLIV